MVRYNGLGVELPMWMGDVARMKVSLGISSLPLKPQDLTATTH